MKQRNALGRGLGAILDTSNAPAGATPQPSPKNELQNFQEIPLEYIETNPYQPRTHFEQEALLELCESIKLHGIITPITVRRLSATQYQLISGERRFQASKLAGKSAIPAYIRTANDQEMLEMALIENIQRENLNAIEIALSYQRLLSECDLKQEELGDRVGKKRSTVNNYLRLLRLPPAIQAALKDERISMGHARAIINIEDIDLQLAVYEKIITEELSVRKVEELVKNLKEGQTKDPNATEKKDAKTPKDVEQLQRQLSTHYGTKIHVKSNEKYKGEIKIPFMSLDDLNRILELLELS